MSDKDILKHNKDFLTDRTKENLQGNIVWPHRREHTAFLFLKFSEETNLDKLKFYLTELAEPSSGNKKRICITSAKVQNENHEKYKGYKILQSPQFFMGVYLSKSGMTKLVGDQDGYSDIITSLNDIEGLEIGEGENIFTPDILLLLAHSSKDILKLQMEKFEEIFKQGYNATTFIDYGNVYRNRFGQSVEHFGYADGLSQPWFLKKQVKDEKYENRNGWSPIRSLKDDFLIEEPDENCYGSLLVYRKFEQNVNMFNKDMFDEFDVKEADLKISRDNNTPSVLNNTSTIIEISSHKKQKIILTSQFVENIEKILYLEKERMIPKIKNVIKNYEEMNVYKKLTKDIEAVLDGEGDLKVVIKRICSKYKSQIPNVGFYQKMKKSLFSKDSVHVQSLKNKFKEKYSEMVAKGGEQIGRFKDGTVAQQIDNVNGKAMPALSQEELDKRKIYVFDVNDIGGGVCPHIGNMNRRKEMEKMILRRGMTYGERKTFANGEFEINDNPSGEVGLHFVSFQNDISTFTSMLDKKNTDALLKEDNKFIELKAGANLYAPSIGFFKKFKQEDKPEINQPA